MTGAFQLDGFYYVKSKTFFTQYKRNLHGLNFFNFHLMAQFFFHFCYSFFLCFCSSFLNCPLYSTFLFFVPQTRSYSPLLLFATIVHHYFSTAGNHTTLLSPPLHYNIAMMKASASFSSPPFPDNGPRHR